VDPTTLEPFVLRLLPLSANSETFEKLVAMTMKQISDFFWPRLVSCLHCFCCGLLLALNVLVVVQYSHCWLLLVYY